MDRLDKTKKMFHFNLIDDCKILDINYNVMNTLFTLFIILLNRTCK
jgi:hypothetical protein